MEPIRLYWIKETEGPSKLAFTLNSGFASAFSVCSSRFLSILDMTMSTLDQVSKLQYQNSLSRDVLDGISAMFL